MPPRKTTNYRKNSYGFLSYGYYPSNYNRPGTTSSTTRSSQTATWFCNSPKFKTVQRECQWRIGSYRNVYSQFTGAGTKTFFSPTIANRWLKYVNNGAFVYKFTNQEFCRHFGNRWNNGTPRAACQYLRNHYGTSIKDVTRGKGNCWLVAATRTPTARPFNTYNWK